MMIRIILGFFLILIVIVSGISDVPYSYAQGNDCGNGLIQRLQLGGRGWIDPTPPAQGVRVRVAPGDTEIYRLQPGEAFIVLDGPECYDTHSWWQIQVDNNSIVGWIAEGIEAGTYFVDPLNTVASVTNNAGGVSSDNPVIRNTNPVCEGTASLKVGDMVEIISEDLDDLYYGHPLIPDAFFSITNYQQTLDPEYMSFFKELDMVDWLSVYDEGIDQPISKPFMLTEGPICFNGQYLWQVLPTFNMEVTERTHYNVWVAERTQSGNQLRLSEEQIMPQPAYDIPETLLLPPSAPLISPEEQISFDFGAGGGGGGIYPRLFERACNYPSESFAYTSRCVLLYPFPIGEIVQVTLRQPDGTIFAENNFEAKPYDMQIEISGAWSFMSEGFDISVSDPYMQTLSVGAVQVTIPTQLGLPSGVWTIEATSATHSTQQAYQLLPTRNKRNLSVDLDYYITPYCIFSEPIYLIQGIPNTTVDVVFLEAKRWLNASVLINVAFQETQRFTITLDDTGLHIVRPTYPLKSGFLYITDVGSERNDSNPFSASTYSTETDVFCDVGENINDALLAPLSYNRLSALSRNRDNYVSFYGTQGDSVRVSVAQYINLITYVDPSDEEPSDVGPNIRIEIIAPNGDLIAQSQPIQNPIYGDFASEIRDLILPQTGLYIIKVPEINNIMPIWLSLEGDGVQPQFVGNLLAIQGQQITMNTPLDETLSQNQTVTWVFDGRVGVEVTIAVDSDMLDPKVVLLDSMGNILAEDDDSGERTNALISQYSLPADDIYLIRVSAWGGKGGDYRLTVTEND